MSNREYNKKRRRLFRKYDGMKYGWLKDTEKFLVLLFVVFLMFRFVIGFSFVKGDSMLPTLHDGEVVFYTRIHKDFKNNDIVSVRIPSGEYYVKRIIATEGDTIELRDGRVYINQELLDEPYVEGSTLEQEGNVKYPMTLTEGQIFVMGDNRYESMDSRFFGVIGERQIKGKIWLRAGKFYLKVVR